MITRLWRPRVTCEDTSLRMPLPKRRADIMRLLYGNNGEDLEIPSKDYLRRYSEDICG